MILTREVEANVSGQYKQYYIDKGYVIPERLDRHGKMSTPKGTRIIVKVEDLPINSHEKVQVSCDNCGEILTMTYQSYNDRIRKFGEVFCKKCSKIHHQKTVKEKYGVDNISQLQSVKDKKRKKSIEKYGTDTPLQHPDIKKQIKKTNVEKYGVPYPTQNEQVKEKTRNTIIEKYGSVENFTSFIIEKGKETNLTKYGNEYYFCTDDYREKTKNTCLKKYGVNQIGKISGLVEKREKTMMDRYGYDNPLKCPEIKQRVFDTNTKKYGHRVATLSPEIFEKIKKTNLERYGHEYATLVPEIREKMKQTCIERYGYESALQNPQIQAKTRETLSKNGTMCSSSQQRYINSLYNGQLNYKLSKFFVDIYIEEESLCVEYDGGAHDLSVQTGKITQEEFDKREMVREKIIKSYGNRIIRIISPTDKLPSDKILLQMLHEALEYFNATNHTWRNYYVELGIMKDAEHKDGAKYDYGTLWNAKVLAKQNKSA